MQKREKRREEKKKSDWDVVGIDSMPGQSVAERERGEKMRRDNKKKLSTESN